MEGNKQFDPSNQQDKVENEIVPSATEKKTVARKPVATKTSTTTGLSGASSSNGTVDKADATNDALSLEEIDTVVYVIEEDTKKLDKKNLKKLNKMSDKIKEKEKKAKKKKKEKAKKEKAKKKLKEKKAKKKAAQKKKKSKKK